MAGTTATSTLSNTALRQRTALIDASIGLARQSLERASREAATLWFDYNAAEGGELHRFHYEVGMRLRGVAASLGIEVADADSHERSEENAFSAHSFHLEYANDDTQNLVDLIELGSKQKAGTDA
jgi:hypothetical protein